MSAQSDLGIESLVGEILAGARVSGAAEVAAWQKPEKDLRRLVHRDYVRDLRRNLSYRELRALLDAVDEVLPHLNREPIGMMPVAKQAEVASHLRVHFKAAPHTGNGGLALRGFYVNKMQKVLKRPLIYVNTAHHPLAVSVTFCHEVGHHFATDIFQPQEHSVHLFFDADYSCHLSDPAELAADVLVSLAGYPEPVARRIFAKPWDWGLVARAGNLTDAAFSEIRTHLKAVYGLDLTAGIPPRQSLNYLCGMIHYAKLRWALLAEYDL